MKVLLRLRLNMKMLESLWGELRVTSHPVQLMKCVLYSTQLHGSAHHENFTWCVSIIILVPLHHDIYISCAILSFSKALAVVRNLMILDRALWSGVFQKDWSRELFIRFSRSSYEWSAFFFVKISLSLRNWIIVSKVTQSLNVSSSLLWMLSVNYSKIQSRTLINVAAV